MQIAVSSWSFHGPLYGGALQLVDVPLAVYELGVRHVELNDRFLTSPPQRGLARLLGLRSGRGAKREQPSGPDYGRDSLMRLRHHRLRSGTRLVCWTIDTDLTVESPEERSAQRAYIGTAIEAARFLGAPILRLTLGGESGHRILVERAIDLLRSVAPVAAVSGVRLAIENHGGLSSDIDSLEEVVAAFGPTRGSASRATIRPVGVCLDVSHFREGEHAAGMSRLSPLAIHVHAMSRAFDASGEEASVDYRMSMRALREAGYDSAISIEYGGDGDPAEGIRNTKRLIEKYWTMD
jgi:sugar phosphate isomerase/epimerase